MQESEPNTLAVNYWSEAQGIRKREEQSKELVRQTAAVVRTELSDMIWANPDKDLALKAALEEDGWDQNVFLNAIQSAADRWIDQIVVVNSCGPWLEQLCEIAHQLEDQTVFLILHRFWRKLDRQYCEVLLHASDRYIRNETLSRYPHLASICEHADEM